LCYSNPRKFSPKLTFRSSLGGNQREQDRLKAQKKQGGKAKATTMNGQSLKNKQER
jgi:hypothetical protein